MFLGCSGVRRNTAFQTALGRQGDCRLSGKAGAGQHQPGHGKSQELDHPEQRHATWDAPALSCPPITQTSQVGNSKQSL